MTATSVPSDMGVPPKLAPPDPQQAKAIKEKIDAYVEGLRTGDVGMLMKAFRDEAVVCGYIDSGIAQGARVRRSTAAPEGAED